MVSPSIISYSCSSLPSCWIHFDVLATSPRLSIISANEQFFVFLTYKLFLLSFLSLRLYGTWGTKLNTCQRCPLRTSSSHCRVCRAEIEKKVLTSMRIPNRFRGLYRLHLSTQPPITIIMKLTTIRSDGRVEALLVTNPWSWRKSHPMSFRSVPSTRYGDGGLDQDGLDCYKEERYRWICAPHVVPVSRPRPAGAAGFLRLFPAHAVSIATIFIFFG